MFSLKEQKAILQCIWQVLASNPTHEENDLIQNSLLANWECMKMNDMDIFEAIKLNSILECEIKPWIVVAVKEDPYDSFSIVRNLTYEKKMEVKRIILELIESCDNYSRRAPYVHTLFTNCNIPFKVKEGNLPNGYVGNVIK